MYFYNVTTATSIMAFDNASNVGIGTGSPGAKLHVNGGSLYVTSSGTYAEPATIAGVIAFDSTNGDLNISSRSNGGNTFTRFFTSSSGAGAERMRITSGGNVLVNTTSGTGQLTVNSGSGAASILLTNTSTSNPYLQFANGSFIQGIADGSLRLRTTTAFPLIFDTNSTERMRIDASGNVGIGTTPTGRLDVNGNIRTTVGSGGTLTLHETDATRANQLVSGADASGSYINASFATGGSAILRFQTANTERMRVTAAGDVGIGTTAPAGYGKLAVIGNIASSTDGATVLTMRANTNATSLGSYNATGSTLAFQTNASGSGEVERMRITSAGDVGVGTTSPGGKLGIVGGATQRKLSLTGSAFTDSAVDLFIGRTGTSNTGVAQSPSIQFSNDTTASGIILQGANDFQLLTNNAGAGWVERMRVTNAGDVGVGATAPANYTNFTTLDINHPTNGGLLNISKAGATVGYINGSSGLLMLANATNLVLHATGANTLQFLTNSNERMRVTSAGDVGIGTSAPGGKLEVYQTAATPTIRMFTNFVGGNAVDLNPFITGVSNGGYSLSIGGTIRQVFNTTGDMGIGTTGPSTRLHVAKGVANEPCVTRTETTSSGNNFDYAAATVVAPGVNGGVVAWATGSLRAGQMWVQTNGTQPLVLGTNDTERARIDSTGNMGVGTSAPWERLSIPFNDGLAFGSSTYSYKITRSSAGSLVTTFSDSYNDVTARVDFTMRAGAVTAMSILGSGNVGIGTTSPAARLHAAGITRISDATNSTAVAIDPVTTAGLTSITAQFGGSQLAFGSAATERMRLDASGNLGIGVTGPATRLDVRANNPTRGIIYLGRNDGSTGQTGSQMQLSQNGIADWAFGQPAGVGDFAFWVGRNPTADGSEVLRLISTGGITSPNVADAVGYKGLPQNSQTAAYTLALSDMGKHISITTGGVVIPANGSVAFPIGSAVTIFNNSGSNQTISITTDTLRQAGTANTGSRTLAQYGVATVLKVTSTVWVISGAGVS
jgi:hypothetical protein